MGLHDRSYAREYEGGSSGPGLAMHVRMIIATVVIYVIDSVIVNQNPSPALPGIHPLTQWGELHADWFTRPWEIYRLITHGFLHAHLGERTGLMHILFNMYLLFVMGRMLESAIGGQRLLVLYLSSIVAGGLAWSAISSLAGDPGVLRGASGGVSGVLVATCYRFAREKIFLFGIIEMPLWGFGVLSIALDVMGALGVGESNVAYTAHIGGAVLGLVFARSGENFASWFDPQLWRKKLRRRPKLSVVRDEYGDLVDKDAAEEDRILAKCHKEGSDSLTPSERRFMKRRSELARKKLER